VRNGLDGTGSGPCPVSSFGIDSVETSVLLPEKIRVLVNPFLSVYFLFFCTNAACQRLVW
jgi:hypothetical protein